MESLQKKEVGDKEREKGGNKYMKTNRERERGEEMRERKRERNKDVCAETGRGETERGK